MNDSIYSPGPGYTTRIRQRSRLRFLAGILVRAAN